MLELVRPWTRHPRRRVVPLRREFAAGAFFVVPGLTSNYVDFASDKRADASSISGEPSGIAEQGDFVTIDTANNSEQYTQWPSDTDYNPPSTGYSMFFLGRRRADGGSTYNRIWHRDVAGASQTDSFGFLIIPPSDAPNANKVYFANYVGNTVTSVGFDVSANPAASTTRFAYYLATHDGATLRLYLDGALLESLACGVPGTSSRVMRIGKVSDTISTGAPFDLACFGYVRSCIPPDMAFSPWQLLEPETIWVPQTAVGGTVPTLSNLTAINITSTSAQPSLTYAY